MEGDFSKHGVNSRAANLSPLSAAEQQFARRKPLPEGHRLSCSARIEGDLVVDVPASSQVHRQVVRKAADSRVITLDPVVHLHYVEVEQPDMHDPSGDLQRLMNALLEEWNLSNLQCDLQVLQSLQPILRAGDWKVTVAVHAASRGGDVTYHGPGQLVGYPILRLRGGVVSHIEAMARGLAALLRGFGVAAIWRRDAPGLWIDRGEGNRLAKICAFGVHVRRRVTIHGFALNVTNALDAFDLIVPCGLRDAAVTSMAALTDESPALAALAPLAAEALAHAFGVSFIERTRRDR